MRAIEEITLEGFLTNIRAPSKERTMVSFDCSHLSGINYMDLIKNLQDTLSRIDEKYSERETRGRSLKGRYRKIAKVRKRILTFAPLPSKFINKIGTLRFDVYRALNLYSLVLEEEKIGMFKRNLYLAPYVRAPTLLRTVQELNEEIKELNEEITKFIQSGDVKDIEELLRMSDVMGKSATFPYTPIPEITVDLTPFTVTPSAKYERLKEIDLEGYKMVEEVLRHGRSLVLTKAITKMATEVQFILGKVADKKLKNPEEQLNSLKQMCEDLGLRSLANTITVTLDEIKEGKEIEKVQKETNARVKSLLESL